MRSWFFSLEQTILSTTLTCAVVLALATGTLAVDGIWTNPAGGDYNDPANWAASTVATGAASTANFNTLDITSDVNVSLESPLTIGNLTFGDTNLTSAGTWAINTTNQAATIVTLDNGASKPNISVNALAPTTFDSVFIGPSLAGTNGFNKMGSGVLELAAGATNTITGGINVNEGTLRAAAFLPAQTIALANGATFDARASQDAVGTRIFSVAAGATANLTIGASVEVGRFDAAGANLNVNFPATAAAGTRFTPSGNWLASGATNNPATFTVNSAAAAPTSGANTGAVVRLAPNLSSASGGIRNFNGATFTNTSVTINNSMFYARTNSGGNTFSFGSLSGDANAILSGGNQGGAAVYSIGALNTNTEFAGTIDTTSSFAAESSGANTGGLSLLKVGTGTLTLSGTLSYQPTLNGTVNRRGGVTTVSAGTLALKNNAQLPAGIAGQNSVVNVLSGATLNVSASTLSGGYNSSPLQTTVGVGTIVGNYVHDDGILSPGDTVTGATGTNPNPTPNSAAGTLTFSNNLSFNNATTGGAGGTVKFDISPSTSSGNDLIQVNGTTTLTGTVTLTPSFLGGFTTGTYTLINSTGGFLGNTSGWTVNWPGRGTAPSLAVNGNLLQMTVGAGSTGNVTWSGATDGTWVAGSGGPLNWWNNASNVADRFFDLDTANFADTFGPSNTPVTNSTITLSSAVTPVALNVNNSAVNYSITGSGKITGGAAFTKSGNGTLILQTANDFTGPAVVQGGTVDIGTFNGALGTGAITLQNATIIAANTASAGLTNASMTISGNSTIRVDGTAGTPLALPSYSGSGTLNLTTTITGKLIDISANTAYTGTLNIGADGTLATGVTVRFNGAGSSLPSSPVNLSVGAAIRDRATSAQTIALGSLTGDSTTQVGGYTGGSGATAKTWQIGALNSSTTFDGTITNGAGSSSTTAVTNIQKVGTGILTLTGTSDYAGTTVVDGGTLLVNGSHTPNTAITGANFGYTVNTGGTLGGTGTIGNSGTPVSVPVTVAAGGTLAPGASIGTLSVVGDVSFADSTSIFKVEANGESSTSDTLAVTGNLALNGAALMASLLAGTTPAGAFTIATYTGTLSGTFTVPSGIAVDYGTGSNSQITMIINSLASPLIGDYNNNGKVDAADYVVWRRSVGDGSLPNRDPGNAGPIGNADYNSWRAHFGQTAGSGAGVAAAAVPEPATWLLALFAATSLARRRIRHK